MTRHPNCKPVSLGERKPAVSMSGQTKRGLRAEIKSQVDDFIARGNEIKRLPSEIECARRYPAFDYLAAESGGGMHDVTHQSRRQRPEL